MARVRRPHAGVEGKFSDDSPDTWLTEEDRTVVELAGTSPRRLATATGARGMRFHAVSLEDRPRFALALLAQRRRYAAIETWANDNNIPSWRAHAHFEVTCETRA